jgi:hypothetical protein
MSSERWNLAINMNNSLGNIHNTISFQNIYFWKIALFLQKYLTFLDKFQNQYNPCSTPIYFVKKQLAMLCIFVDQIWQI